MFLLLKPSVGLLLTDDHLLIETPESSPRGRLWLMYVEPGGGNSSSSRRTTVRPRSPTVINITDQFFVVLGKLVAGRFLCRLHFPQAPAKS